MNNVPVIKISEPFPAQCCGNCFNSKPVPLQKGLVTCRANLPVLLTGGPGQVIGMWPPVEAREGWCAHWKEKAPEPSPQESGVQTARA